MLDPFTQRAALFFIASNWFYTYNFSGFNATQFNIRSRGLNSSLFWLGQMAAAAGLGWVLDQEKWAPKARAIVGLAVAVGSVAASLSLAAYINFTSVAPCPVSALRRPADLSSAPSLPSSHVTPPYG